MGKEERVVVNIVMISKINYNCLLEGGLEGSHSVVDVGKKLAKHNSVQCSEC